MMPTGEQLLQLEQLVDACGLPHVLDALATICALKAEHVNHAWQDRALASAWNRAAGVCDRAAANRAVVNLP